MREREGGGERKKKIRKPKDQGTCEAKFSERENSEPTKKVSSWQNFEASVRNLPPLRAFRCLAPLYFAFIRETKYEAFSWIPPTISLKRRGG